MRAVPRADLPPGAWDAFVDAHREGWFWHRSEWLDYQVAYRPGNADESFAVVDERGELSAVVPLVACDGEGGRELSFSGVPGPFFLGHGCNCCAETADALAAVEARRAAGDAALAEVLRRTGARRWVAEAAVPGDGAPAALRVVDLAPDEEELWRGVRHSYRSLIRRGSERHAVRVDTGDSDATLVGFLLYQQLHARLARVPRPPSTYAMQGAWAMDGRGVIVTARDPDDGGFSPPDPARSTRGAAYWIAYKGRAYYASGAYADDDVAHAVVWRSLLALRGLGVRAAVLGWQGVARDEKERNIEFFKRGFGGRDEPVWVKTVEFGR